MTFKQIPELYFVDRNSYSDKPETYFKIDMKWVEEGEIKEKRAYPDDPDDLSMEYYIGNPDNNITKIEFRQRFNNKIIDWNSVETIYFHPSCTVPRFKLQKFYASKQVKAIKDEDKADVILYGSNYITGIFENDTDDFVKKTTLINRIKKHTPKQNLDTEILPALELSTSEYVILAGYNNPFKKENKDKSINYNYISDYNKYEQLTQRGAKFYHQDNVLTDIATGVIDNTMFRSICTMFSSEDGANHTIAMEIMSNCSYKESIVYLLELMRRYYGVEMFQSNTRNHVSFKALRSYLQYEPRHVDGMDNIIENLIEKNLLTEVNYRLILDLTKEKVNADKLGENSGYNREDTSWILKEIDLIPEYKAKIIWDKKKEPQLIDAV